MPREIAEAPASGLGKILMEGRFAVPTHQRDYSWSEDEVTLLLEDVESAIARGDGQYFVGLMVFMGGEEAEQTVLDGQQRLATVVIFFSAVRNWLRQYSQFLEDATKIQQFYIGRSELGESTALPRLNLNSANRETFQRFVVESVPTADVTDARGKLKRYDRNRRLLDAIIFCNEWIAERAKTRSPDDAMKHLIGMVRYFVEAVSVVRLNVSNEETAFTIFETLNDRGLELSPLDLVKNFFLERHRKPAFASRLLDYETWKIVGYK